LQVPCPPVAHRARSGGDGLRQAITLLKNRETCYCPLCGSEILVPFSSLDSRLSVGPRYACCQAVYDWLRETIETKTDAPRSCQSETLDEGAASGLSALFG
jgi:hypothetical protein